MNKIELWREEYNAFIQAKGDDAFTDKEVIQKGIELEEKINQYLIAAHQEQTLHKVAN